MPDYILPTVLIIISGFVFLQNRKPIPIEERAIAFDDPWAPLIYIPTGLGVYLFLQIGIRETIVGWFVSLFISSILYGIFEKTINK